jgi:acetolactate synthase-1/2/3 large subunit
LRACPWPIDIPAATIRREDEVDGAIAWLFASGDGPALLQVMIDTRVKAYPKIAFGRPIGEMEPLAVPRGFGETS